MSPVLSAAVAIENSVVLAQLSATSGTALRDVALGIIGTLTLIVMAARALGAYADEHFGKLFTLVLAAVPVFGFSYFPDATAALLAAIWSSFFQ